CSPKNKYYDYFDFLTGWNSAFPDSKFEVKIFDKKELYSSDVISDICRIIDIDRDNLETIHPVNESVKPTGQEILKIINKNMPSLIEGVGRNQERSVFVRIISKIFSGSGQKPDSGTAFRIQAQFDDINKKVRQRWFPDRQELF